MPTSFPRSRQMPIPAGCPSGEDLRERSLKPRWFGQEPLCRIRFPVKSLPGPILSIRVSLSDTLLWPSFLWCRTGNTFLMMQPASTCRETSISPAKRVLETTAMESILQRVTGGRNRHISSSLNRTVISDSHKTWVSASRETPPNGVLRKVFMPLRGVNMEKAGSTIPYLKPADPRPTNGTGSNALSFAPGAGDGPTRC